MTAATQPPAKTAGRKIHMVSLGCPKNRVDTERMLGRLLAEGGELVADPAQADVLMVNTCAFIEDSKKESVDAILELAEHKAARPGSQLVVAGCLAQRYAPELAAEIPEVDHFVGTGEIHRIAETWTPGAPALGGKKRRPEYLAAHLEPRYVPDASFSAYLKIAEGCSQGCSFCIIPKLRGAMRSRQVEDCVAEARQLVQAGVVEINLVAQDLTHYGEDYGDPDALAKLVRALGSVDGLRWVRLHYAYPHNFTADLVAAMAETDNCLPYVDMPLQHASDAVLKAMNRKVTRAEMEQVLGMLRAAMPDITLRTTFLVGHPGETEDDFEQLVDFVEAWRFDRVGCFAYSQEEGTPSARRDHQLPTMVKRARRDRIMAMQRHISREKLAGLRGQTVEVLVEGLSDETDLLLQGRMRGQAPEIDGVTYINDAPDDIGRGQLRQVEITQTEDYDVIGHVVA
jgi:ribosomal protein S12 methylthiotransferase